MKPTTKKMLPTTLGAALGFVAFVFLGAIPGVLYGGYAGLALSNLLFGSGGDPTVLTRIMTFGGMATGLLVALTLFVLVGAIIGTGVGVLVKRVGRAAEVPKTPETRANES